MLFHLELYLMIENYFKLDSMLLKETSLPQFFIFSSFLPVLSFLDSETPCRKRGRHDLAESSTVCEYMHTSTVLPVHYMYKQYTLIICKYNTL